MSPRQSFYNWMIACFLELTCLIAPSSTEAKNLDCYGLMGVQKTSDFEEIKRSYRKLVQKYHPDHPVQGMSKMEQEEKFKDAATCYDRIGDADNRKKYDEFGNSYFEDAPAGPPTPGNTDGSQDTTTGSSSTHQTTNSGFTLEIVATVVDQALEAKRLDSGLVVTLANIYSDWVNIRNLMGSAENTAKLRMYRGLNRWASSEPKTWPILFPYGVSGKIGRARRKDLAGSIEEIAEKIARKDPHDHFAWTKDKVMSVLSQPFDFTKEPTFNLDRLSDAIKSGADETVNYFV